MPSAEATQVLDGSRPYAVDPGDCIAWLNDLPADSVSLCLFSPPYELARTYFEGGKNLGIARKTDAWVAWMLDVFCAAQRVCTGLVACVCEGQTRKFKYSAGPVLLMADLHRAGFNLRKPPIFHRSGIPGSGGTDWLRNNYEFIVCTSRPGKLPWSDSTACGHPPRWAPGGAMSHRLGDGRRRNQWGGNSKGPHERKANGERQSSQRPSHVMSSNRELKGRRAISGYKDGDVQAADVYVPPVLANPGNVITCSVGGGQMGHKLAHSNEAPYPLKLCEFFVRSFCPPNGITCDPFSGSATTGHAAILYGRRFLGCDLRPSQVDLGKRRLAGITPDMFSA